MWHSLREFLVQVFSELGSAVTGGLSAPLLILTLFSSGTPRIAFMVLGIVGVYVASFRVWKRERDARQEMAEKLVKAEERLNAKADMQGTIWVKILEHNPFQDQTHPGSGLQYLCECANFGRQPCEISKISLLVSGEAFKDPLRQVMLLPPAYSGLIEHGKRFMYEGSFNIRGIEQGTLRTSTITIHLIDSLGVEYQNTVTQVAPPVAEVR
jgi:hypothetical protein